MEWGIFRNSTEIIIRQCWQYVNWIAYLSSFKSKFQYIVTGSEEGKVFDEEDEISLKSLCVCFCHTLRKLNKYTDFNTV